MTLNGIHTALVTPFDQDHALDTAALSRSVEHQITSGTAGLCPLGGTGEPLSMSVDEHKAVIDTVTATADGRVPITVGCLLGGQRDILTVARHAKSAGANQIMIVPPYFFSAKFFDIKNHIQAVAEAVDLPIIFFHSPGRSGIRLSADQILELCHDIPSIIGIKDASGDAILAGDIIAGSPDGFSFMQGLDELLLPTLATGAVGGVVSLADLLPRTLSALYNHTMDGNIAAARDIQLRIMPFCCWIYSEPNPGPLKYALKLAGRPAGPCRAPIYGPTDATREALEKLLPALLEHENA